MEWNGTNDTCGIKTIATIRGGLTQPRWGWGNLTRLTQGSSCLATLGWRTKSRWDSRNGGRP
jgi:hypothetical protein